MIPELEQQIADYSSLIKPEIDKVLGLLNQRVSDAPEELIQDLIEIEAHNALILTYLAESNAFLDRATFVLRPAKGEGSETDREVTTDAATAPLRSLRDKLEALGNAIKQRLIMGESILSYQKQFKDHGNPQVALQAGTSRLY